MIISFGSELTKEVFHNHRSKITAKFPPDLYHLARRKLFYVHYARRIDELQSPPGNRLEKLHGNLEDFWSIRINQQWRLIFKWIHADAYLVEIVDYH